MFGDSMPFGWYARARVDLRHARRALAAAHAADVAGDGAGYLTSLERATAWLCNALEARELARTARRARRWSV